MQWNLIRFRKELNLNQKDMSKLLKLSEAAYRYRERGERQFLMDEMFLLSKFFGRPIEEIFLPRNFGNTEIGVKK
ncbi:MULTISPECIES: helix-turn-helix transcriptional regulator [unclassified Oceanobacillus]|uniref:helix-turn-helix transcriptional regulator n=1 Tax=unclassified Oceanobacillus TaxID=2630292 RepID=UPI001BEB830A|nr:MULTISPECIES: helix-turn-helix transcriptional regulator [unclassified Oceanobacillus]MBT2600919.1 helix-turn-helix transcriptional regulator [Oceanobacillus sp. ISL-74]MBT2653420.1 helix-turn-helix transcriptional regulator [Oceanobacillus sp. ISL-73]